MPENLEMVENVLEWQKQMLLEDDRGTTCGSEPGTLDWAIKCRFGLILVVLFTHDHSKMTFS